MGDLQEAVARREEATPSCGKPGDRRYEAEALGTLAPALAEPGAKKEARTNWNRAADLFTRLRIARAGDTRAEADALS
ncbi:hypothetical protein [Kitasatospora indigofera]|uniref:hypothetical protein n=1 Tax=Kitasatospora indigofera TaxID=67307 RepID=UPI0033B65721